MITACHNCELNGKGDPRCINCKRVNQDDIRIKRSPHAKSEFVAAVEDRDPDCPDPGQPCTNLPADIEDTLRKAMSSFWSLDPIQLLCVQHIMQGKKLSAFGETLRAVHEKIRKYRGSERAQAGMMRDAIAKRIPFIAPIINTHLKADGRVDEHDGVVSLLDEPAGDLFEWGGVDAPFDPLERRTRR